MIIEVVGYKGVVGDATYRFLKAMHLGHEIIGRDKGDVPGKSNLAFMCVPESCLEVVCSEIAPLTDFMVVRSTVMPGTCKRLQMKLGKHVCHNPEFLREVTAVQDVFNPAYILIGACCSEHAKTVQRLYEPAQVHTVVVQTVVSELVKVVTNNYLACLVSFWNEMESVCQASGVSGHRVSAIASLDARISSYGARYHHRYGGKCLPKEVEMMLEYADEKRLDLTLIPAVKEVNECQTS